MAKFFPPLPLPVFPPFEKLNALYRPRRSVTEMTPPPADFPDSSQMIMSLTTRGLLNPTGDNNCFLNSAVQVLWHIDVFRKSFREVKGHYCVGKSCIFCSLKSLFNQFQYSPGQSALPPDSLRQALAVCYEGQHRFQLGLMDDAAECFEKILEQVHYHLTGTEDMDSCAATHCLAHEKFALTVLERTECRCGATSEPLSFVQFVHYVSSSALSKEAKQVSEGTSFSKILNRASAFGENKQCSNYVQCKQDVVTKRILLNSPDVFCLGLIWDSASPSVDDIMSVVNSIGLSLRLNELFDHVFSDTAQSNELQLTAIVAYYGRHYSTFCYHSKLKEWIYFDDARYRTIGSDWSLVCEEVRKAHYQPLLLVYTNPFGEVVDLSHAPTEVTLLQSTPSQKALSPLAEETPEDIFSASLTTGPEVTGSLPQVATVMTPPTTISSNMTLAAPPTSTIDPLTLSIVPVSLQLDTHPASTNLTPADKDLMLFSISPFQVKHNPIPSKTQQPLSQASVTSTALPTSRFVDRRVADIQTKMSPNHPHSTNISLPSATPTNCTHPPLSSPVALSTRENVTSPFRPTMPSGNDGRGVRVQPKVDSPVLTSPMDSNIKMQMSSKSNVSVSETRVYAQSHAYLNNKETTLNTQSNNDGGNDLMTFGVSPVAVPTTQMSAAVVPQVNETEDLIKFSLHPEHVAKIHNDYARGVRDRPSHMTAHDRRMPAAELNPKWDHFAHCVSETSFGDHGVYDGLIMPNVGVVDKKVGGVNNDQWTVLSMSGAETILSANEWNPSGTETPAIRSLKRVSSVPTDQSKKKPLPQLKHHPCVSGIPPSPVGNSPRLVANDPLMAEKARTTNLQRPLPDIPTESRSRNPVYAELDFQHSTDIINHKSPSNKGVGQTYTEIMIPAEEQKRMLSSNQMKPKVATSNGSPESTKEVTVTNNTLNGVGGVSVMRSSDQPITEDPLYAVPDKIKLKAKAIKGSEFDGISDSTKSLLFEARDLLAKANAVEGSDNTVALMLFTQYKSILDKVLRDPAVVANPTLSQQVRGKHEEGVVRCNKLKPRQDNVTSERVRGVCNRCANKREVDKNWHLCGPCILRVKMGQ